MNFLISIVIPCYNCENELQRCIDSIFNQSYHDFEVILIDDGSTDRTAHMCDQFEENDKRTRVTHQENRGLMAAWKRGVRESAGDYIVFVDSDDWVENDLLERLSSVIANEQPDMITYGIRTDYSDGSFLYLDNRIRNGLYQRDEIEREILPQYFFDDGMGTMSILPSRSAKAVRRNILINNMDILKDSISIGEDDVTSFAVLQDVQTIYNIEKYYPYHYCRRKGSMLGNYTVETVKKFVEVKKELYHIADIKKNIYKEQIELNFGENLLVVLKKIMVDMGYDLKTIKNELEQICRIDEVKKFLESKEVLKRFGIKERLMTKLILKKKYGLCCWLAGMADSVIRILRW